LFRKLVFPNHRWGGGPTFLVIRLGGAAFTPFHNQQRLLL